MTRIEAHNRERSGAWDALEPYAQVIRSLLPRAEAVVLFDSRGELRWSSQTTTGPDLVALVEHTVSAAGAGDPLPGQLSLLGGEQPVYLCCLRDDAGALLGIVAIVCRPGAGGAAEQRAFPFVHSLVRPALECLRRELLARSAIESLTRTVSTLDQDLELLLADSDSRGERSETSDGLHGLLEKTLEHLKCVKAALIVPEKGLVLMRVAAGQTPDNQLVARLHRQLLTMAQVRREPVIINRLAPTPAVGSIPYRILSCPLQHASGRTAGLLALFRDEAGEPFTERDARLADTLTRKAASIIESSYDAMSGLYTRPAFERRVRAVIADSRRPGTWSALYIDSDQLHVINDNFGMHVGDGVIGRLGELLRRRLPPSAFAARISGDRFAVLLPSGLEDAARFAESLREGAEQLSGPHESGRLDVSISIGVAPLDPANGELTHSLAAAETACKAAKDRGRNRVEVYQANDASIVRRFTDINIATQLRSAIEAGRLRLDAQLILPFGAGARARPHYEVLLRMIDEDGQTVGPDRFLSAANRYQLMPTIDRWVIEQTVALLRPCAEQLAAFPLTFAVNFSGQSLHDAEFPDLVLEHVERSGLAPGTFCFELTESATIANIARAEVLMRRLRDLGCGVALDDFGTGLSSLSYLRQLPVTLLKIDGSFVRDILKDPRSESMVRAIAQLARSMSIGTVAEYVETDEIRARVVALGVDYGQGFAIGRPVPLTELLAELPLLAAASAPVGAESPLARARIAAFG